MAYIAEQMELRGDRVDWDSLYVEAIATDQCTHPNLLSAVSESCQHIAPTDNDNTKLAFALWDNSINGHMRHWNRTFAHAVSLVDTSKLVVSFPDPTYAHVCAHWVWEQD